MSIEKITSKIISEASELKDKTLSEARVQSDAVLAEAQKKAQEMVEESKKRGLEEKEKIISRRKSVADIDCRKVKKDITALTLNGTAISQHIR